MINSRLPELGAGIVTNFNPLPRSSGLKTYCGHPDQRVIDFGSPSNPSVLSGGLDVETRLMLWKEPLERKSSGLRCVARVIGRSGCGVFKMRAVTITKNGQSGSGTFVRVGEEVLRLKPIITFGLGSLERVECQHDASSRLCKRAARSYFRKKRPSPLPVILDYMRPF